ncbi:hypothetical protein [Paraburkholderia sp. ZP32-5]|uniref:hypothetical protein n=1 Tax=Paraburkholderia sp. ZP32-5 TaxID=2883245 RepID=UPI001F1EAC7B|nr:hypothetical protein [Paraburkholderia sp. ZP32-5]
MYRFFRRFERLAFGIVTASAIVCAGVLVAHRVGDVSIPDFSPRDVVNAGFPFAFVCEDLNQVGSCARLLADWTEAQ